MTKSNVPDPSTVKIPLSPADRRRKLVARYLHVLAQLIEAGKVRAFDLAWGVSVSDAPQGALVMESDALVMAPDPEPIEVEDLSAALRRDQTCGNPKCSTCSNKS